LLLFLRAADQVVHSWGDAPDPAALRAIGSLSFANRQPKADVLAQAVALKGGGMLAPPPAEAKIKSI